jgi:hypothetical protein
MKKKLVQLGLVCAVAFSFTGCFDKEEVPAGYEGKLLTNNGFAPELLTPGWHTTCGVFDFNCHTKIIKIQTSEGQYTDKVTVRTKDNMNVLFDYVRTRVKVNPTDKIVNALFSDITPNQDNTITLDKMYNTYGKLVITRDIREVVSKYTIDEIRQNYSKIVGEVYTKIRQDFKATPLLLLDVSVGKIIYPKIYNEAILQAKQKEIEIQRIKAENAIKLEKAKAKIAIAKSEYAIKMQEAKRISDYNKMLGESVTPQLLQLQHRQGRYNHPPFFCYA